MGKYFDFAQCSNLDERGRNDGQAFRLCSISNLDEKRVERSRNPASFISLSPLMRRPEYRDIFEN